MSMMLSQLTRAGTIAAAVASTMIPAAAYASQGPGGGPGTASPSTQLAMAIVVYGASALIIAAGLIGAVRQKPTPRP